MSTPVTPPRRIAVAVGLTVALAATVVRDSIAVSPGEPGWLRWLRVLADHPIRAGVATSLLLLALSPSRSDGEERDRTPSS